LPEPTAQEKLSDYQQIEKAIKQEYDDASQFDIEQVGDDFLNARAYYIEFETAQLEGDYEKYYYALIDKNGCKLFWNGTEVVEILQNLIEKKRSFWSRFREFDFADVVAAGIAAAVTTAFVISIVANLIRKEPLTEPVGKEVVALFSIILGYYFGKIRENKK